MDNSYTHIQITEERAEQISAELYGIQGQASSQPGELDFNFRIQNDEGSFLLKVSRPDTELEYLEYQQGILQHVAQKDPGLSAPRPLQEKNGKLIGEYTDESGRIRQVRMLTWVEGRLWSSVNPVRDPLLESLGEQAGRLAWALKGFEHPLAEREFEWDVAQAAWTLSYQHLFTPDKLAIVNYFQDLFEAIQPSYSSLRKSVVHNDANDNNVVVSNDLADPMVFAIIDYGDAIHTQVINDLAICLAYAVMGQADPLAAALPVVKGYHSQHPLKEEELAVLYTLVAMRLVISVTKSAMNREAEPEGRISL